ncbi:MAG: DinB family protein [Saprospiraceae bacterium]|jgi:hypothetical protein|nr:DinB family protein [Saprospiraceae bacterium]
MAKLGRPKIGDYPFFYETYIKLVTEDDLNKTLRQNTKEILDFINKNLAKDWSYRYEELKWTPKEMLLHIIDTERIMSYRALCTSRGDRTHLPGFDQKGYVENSDCTKRSVASLVAEFKSVRNASISLFKNMSRKEADRVGYANAQNITAKALGYILVGHPRHHMQVLIEKYHFE